MKVRVFLAFASFVVSTSLVTTPPRETGAAVPPAVVAAAPLRLAALSPRERASLPDDTPVIALRDRTTTLGAVRARHAALVASRRIARAPRVLSTDLGFFQTFLAPDRARLSIFHGNATPEFVTDADDGKPETPGRLRPKPYPLSTTAYSSAGLPDDYERACAGVTLCLYLPAGVDFETVAAAGKDRFLLADDYFVNDARSCRRTGGAFDRGARMCEYAYPVTQSMVFVPPPPHGFRVTGSCTDPEVFSSFLDSYGVADLRDLDDRLSAAGDVPFTLDASQRCFEIITAAR